MGLGGIELVQSSGPGFWAVLTPVLRRCGRFLLFRAETGAKLQAHRSRPEKKPYFLVRSKRVTIEDTGPELHLALRELPSIGPADCTRRLRASASEFFRFLMELVDGCRWVQDHVLAVGLLSCRIVLGSLFAQL